MYSSDVVQAIDSLIEERNILKHPFYVAWECGELTRDDLAVYARIYYPHVAEFPCHLEAVRAGCSDVVIEDTLNDNLYDERHEPKPHDELWLDFAASLDLDRDGVRSQQPHLAAAGIIETFGRLASASTASGLAALYAYESQQPAVSKAKKDGLIRHYRFDDAEGTAYFDVHAITDISHREGEKEGLVRCLNAGASSDEVLDATRQALDAYWALLDGVSDEIGLPQ